jgi:hypothetical protein
MDDVQLSWTAPENDPVYITLQFVVRGTEYSLIHDNALI